MRILFLGDVVGISGYSKIMNNLKDEILWKFDSISKKPFDPYKVLPDTYSALDESKSDLLFKDAKVV